MSYDRGLAAIQGEMTPLVPHTQYVSHPEWAKHLRAKQGKPEADIHELLDLDFSFAIWDPPILQNGRSTDMGHATWLPEGADYRERQASPFDGKMEDIFNLDPVKEYGPITRAMFEESLAKFHKRQAQLDAVLPGGGTYNSVISFAIAAFGWENFLMAVGTDPERFGAMLTRWADYYEPWYAMWAEADNPVLLTHDDFVWTEGGFLPPEFYRTYVFPAYKRYWAPARAAGKRILFCSDGNYTAYIDDLVEAGADGFIIEPTTSLETICEKYGQTHSVFGNADTRILTLGTPEYVYTEVKRCMDVGRNCPGFFFAVGNHIPPNVPIENADACMEAYWSLRGRG